MDVGPVCIDGSVSFFLTHLVFSSGGRTFVRKSGCPPEMQKFLQQPSLSPDRNRTESAEHFVFSGKHLLSTV